MEWGNSNGRGACGHSARFGMAAQCGASGRHKFRTHTRLQYRLWLRRWSAPLDLPFLLSQRNWNVTLATAEAQGSSAIYDMVAQCGAGGRPKLDLLRTHHTRLQYRLWLRRWSEPLDLPFLLSQRKWNETIATVEAHGSSAIYDMVAQCGAGGRPKLDLLRTHTRLQYRLWLRRWSAPLDLPSRQSQRKCNATLAPVEAHVDRADSVWRPNVVLAAGTNSGHIRGCSIVCG
jgi:hypothetical protein